MERQLSDFLFAISRVRKTNVVEVITITCEEKIGNRSDNEKEKEKGGERWRKMQNEQRALI